jgi:ribosomal-protein-alanine N-acetyltransferase
MQRSLGIEEKLPARLEVIPMRRRHLRGVMAIEHEVYPRPWSAGLFISEMSDDRTRTYLVARVNREIVGYSGMNCWGDEAHVTNIAVDPEWQRHKIGTRLFFEIVRSGIVMGAQVMSLEVRVSNWGAQRMYGSFGFRPVGVRKNYYQEVKEDALVMWADDIHLAPYLDRIMNIADGLPEEVRP